MPCSRASAGRPASPSRFQRTVPELLVNVSGSGQSDMRALLWFRRRDGRSGPADAIGTAIGAFPACRGREASGRPAPGPSE
ncbi:hypothetical protein SAM23877_7012 [Streptomyces ambofaciens ATCC 23877]|uniref:Uncharacterized protein n=1 Tax=Streptomyces ambofaciens (strain ATCC 23877 / 3486 / DSM 40053 / JCM 4204 / NBRC 12836 / NRRL B-2516) TaxID=278992 RepID=A0A0K2B4R5_STRA7|nr:hypothetical protein SAM23877_7012 [Streptomyces ambofaciens ATCC 23877]